MTTTNKITTNVYEIKVNRKWSQVRATSMKALNDWCEAMNIKDWRMVGMMSIAETAESKNLTVVA
jgi:hypothetical protein